MVVHDRQEVEAETQAEAEELALGVFDGTANEPYVTEAYEDTDEDKE
jgi:hypothetical protein